MHLVSPSDGEAFEVKGGVCKKGDFAIKIQEIAGWSIGKSIKRLNRFGWQVFRYKKVVKKKVGKK